MWTTEAAFKVKDKAGSSHSQFVQPEKLYNIIHPYVRFNDL